jgi:hypothetical protein
VGKAPENPPSGFETTLVDVEFARKFFDAMRHRFPPRPPSVKLLTLQEVVKYFVEERPRDPKVDHGVLLARRRRGRILVSQVFLDAENQPCSGKDGKLYGRMLRVGAFEPELEELVAAGHGMILFPSDEP